MEKRKYLVFLGRFEVVDEYVLYCAAETWWDSVGAELHAARGLRPQPRCRADGGSLRLAYVKNSLTLEMQPTHPCSAAAPV